MSEPEQKTRGTRRDILKLAGAAALGAAGSAALGASRVRAAGSGDTTVMYFNPQHLTKGTLAPGAEVVIGPFPTPGQAFKSDSYLGIIGNLTAAQWKGPGWLSVRSNGYPFEPVTCCLQNSCSAN